MSANRQASVVAAFERALGDIRTRVSALACAAAPESRAAMALAYSGGLDSAALLHLMHAYAAQHGIALFAFHIHHGISANADHWLQHCQAECARLGIVFDSRRITLASKASGVEEAARIGRYAALGELCRTHQVPLLLTAHHQDDQAETVLLQLLRGSGVAGMSGMDTTNVAPDLLGDPTLIMARPLLGMARADLDGYVRDHAIAYVEDESNLDPRYARNALRHHVMPALAQYFPGFQQRFARTAQHAQSAQRLLIELAAQDLSACLDGDCLDLRPLQKLSADRVDNLLRYWFGLRAVRMPSTAWLNELRSQLLGAKADAQLCVTHADCHIRRHRDRVYLTSRLEPDTASMAPLSLRWKGEAHIVCPGFHGALHFEIAAQGVDADWLRGQDLQLHYRRGGERLKLAVNRPTKSLKYHCQTLGIPAWERERLPMVSTGEHLLYVAGIGMDSHCFDQNAGERIALRWQAD